MSEELTKAKTQLTAITESLKTLTETIGKLAQQVTNVETLLKEVEAAQVEAAQVEAAQVAAAEQVIQAAEATITEEPAENKTPATEDNPSTDEATAKDEAASPDEVASPDEAASSVASTQNGNGSHPEVSHPEVEQVMIENAEFMKTAIHELRTPMTSIRGYSDMLSNPKMSGELSAMQSQLLTVVRTNSKRMESLLSDMSYINKIRANILIINKKMDMFKNIAQRAEKMAEPVAAELNRQIEFDIPSGLPLLNTDGELMAVAMMKLIENGLRYSQPETGKVIVRGQAEDSKLIITIEDNGVGMSEETLKRLGEMYFRADDDIVRSYKGSGLGVAIAYGLLDALDADHSVTSEVGRGSCFKITLEGLS